MNGRLERIGLALAAPALAVVIALTVSSLVLLSTGDDPLEVYREMLSYGTQLNSIISILNRATPYYVAGLAVAIGFKMNLFNIGVEGQYYLGALVGAIVGAAVELPAPLHVAFICLVAMCTGAAWAGIAGVLKATRGVNEVISTIMLNNIVTRGLAAWLLNRFRLETEGSLQIRTEPMGESAGLPNLNRLLDLFGLDVPQGSELTGFLIIAIVVGVAYYLLIWRTTFGFDLRSSGLNPFASASAGVAPKQMVVKVMLLSGGVAGLIGLTELFNRGQFFGDFPLGLGFTGIAVALLGRNHPVGIAIGALLWGFMERSAQQLDLIDVPKEIVVIMQGTIVLSVVIAYEIVRRIKVAREQRIVAAQLGDVVPAGAAA